MAKTISQAEVALCLVRGDLARLMPKGEAQDIAMYALGIAMEVTQPDINLVNVSERLDWIYNCIVQMDKKRRAITPSSIYI